MNPEQIAETLPIALTGSIREASTLVRHHVGTVEDLGERLFDDIVGALIGRSRRFLSATTL